MHKIINYTYKCNDYYASILLNYLRIWKLEEEEKKLTSIESKPCDSHFMYVISFNLVSMIAPLTNE